MILQLLCQRFYSFNELYIVFLLPIIVYINVTFSFDFGLMIKKIIIIKTYSQVEFDEIRREWATFVLQLIMNHVDASWSYVVSPLATI